MDVDRVVLGDCAEVMRGYLDNSIDCIVTDPPYGLNFMGKAWDKALPPKAAFSEMCRVLKPGALAFVMSSPRQDLMWRMAQLLEESGFELGQSFISWVYASGFPKAYDISKGIDAKKGLQRTVIGKGKAGLAKSMDLAHKNEPEESSYYRPLKNGTSENIFDLTEPASSEAREWSGWKSVTGLKPALEVVFMVQKPLSEKTIVDNVLKWGTGAMNVDACRVPIEKQDNIYEKNPHTLHTYDANYGIYQKREDQKYEIPEGRFPANLLVSDDALNNGNNTQSPNSYKRESTSKNVIAYGKGIGENEGDFSLNYGDIGSFSRFFDLDAWGSHNGFLNVPKAGTGEREYGLYLGEKATPRSKFNLNNGEREERFDGGKLTKRRNTHPTVKPVELMAYLIELGCPRGGVVMDPFVGSGTTCIAAKKLGRRFIGIEIDPESHRIASTRVAAESIKLEDAFAKSEASAFVVK